MRDLEINPLNSIEQARFAPLFESMQRALKLQGKAKATKDPYTRAVRRSAAYFDRCPDDLSAEELRTYFADLLKTHSWSTIKLDPRRLRKRTRFCSRKRTLATRTLVCQQFGVGRGDYLEREWIIKIRWGVERADTEAWVSSPRRT